MLNVTNDQAGKSRNWADILQEIQQIQLAAKSRADQAAREAQDEANNAVHRVRHVCLQRLHQKTSRNIIAYYSGFLSKQQDSGISDEDKNAFMMVIHHMDRSKGLDLLLHTEGGDIAATQSLVDYLRKMFREDIRAIVPQIAMSAGTMLALSCREIWMGKHSNLGPIDPQIVTYMGQLACEGIKTEFERAYREIRKNPARLKVWMPILQKYPPTLLGECDNIMKWSKDFVREQLVSVMFAGDRDAKKKANKIVMELSSHRKNKSHGRHVHFEECKAMGINVMAIETDQSIQDLVLPIHHCYMHLLMNYGAFKIVENHLGLPFIKMISPKA